MPVLCAFFACVDVCACWLRERRAAPGRACLQVHTLSISDGRVDTAAVSPGGEWLAFGCAQLGQLLVWEWQARGGGRTAPGRSGRVKRRRRGIRRCGRTAHF
eukprot:6184791-Pleurochrysis_carterae.AAC.1